MITLHFIPLFDFILLQQQYLDCFLFSKMFSSIFCWSSMLSNPLTVGLLKLPARNSTFFLNVALLGPSLTLFAGAIKSSSRLPLLLNILKLIIIINIIVIKLVPSHPKDQLYYLEFSNPLTFLVSVSSLMRS